MAVTETRIRRYIVWWYFKNGWYRMSYNNENNAPQNASGNEFNHICAAPVAPRTRLFAIFARFYCITLTVFEKFADRHQQMVVLWWGSFMICFFFITSIYFAYVCIQAEIVYIHWNMSIWYRLSQMCERFVASIAFSWHKRLLDHHFIFNMTKCTTIFLNYILFIAIYQNAIHLRSFRSISCLFNFS